jgi:(4S)-4-hydroxy-5-phosphonooxypentane-2,3-dione isomerase
VIVLAVIWKAKPGQEAEAERVLRALTSEARKEPGCLMFQVHRHKQRTGELFIYEQYKDEAALEFHRKAPHFLQYARTELPKFADRVSGELYDPV